MATEVRFRGGTTAQHAAFIGAPKEVTVNTTDWSLRVHDGVTPGGREITGGAGGAGVALAPELYSAIANNAADATNDLDFSAAAIWDSTRTKPMTASAMTKRADAAWAVGSGAGGRLHSTLSDGTLHLYMIHDPVNDLTDYGISDSPSNPTTGGNYPAAYTLFRRVGSVPREGGVIVPFIHDGVLWMRSVVSTDVNDATNFGTAAQTATLKVPTGIRVEAQMLICLLWTHASSSVSMRVSDIALSDEVPSRKNGQVSAPGISAAIALSSQATAMTNTSGQVRYRTSLNSANLFASISTAGWKDYL